MDRQDDPGRFSRVAIVGLSGRFPGARDPIEFWANLRAGRQHLNDRLEDVATFDAGFFGMNLSAACALTAEHRLFLECAWEAFEHAGYVGEWVEGPVAVFAAPCPSMALRGERLPIATLVSRQLHLTGPSLDVHTAGASSLAAVHLACQSLTTGESDMALAGGSTVHPERENRARASRAVENRSGEGYCRPFEAHATGTVMASAVGCVVLKRLEDAARDGDRILAVIRGSAINNDGAHRQDDADTGQVRAVAEALAIAGVDPEEVSYVEAHGVGRRSRDATEIRALTKAFRATTARGRSCAVGSVKGNIGHTGEAAGIVSLIKVVLALQHREIPASLHVERSTTEANSEDSPFFVNSSLRGWTVEPGRRRLAGVTALGEDGTNAHLLVEEASDPPPAMASRDDQLLVLSARTPTALERLTETLSQQLRTSPDTNLADLAYTLLVGRKPWSDRRVVVARSAADAVQALHPFYRSRALTNACTGLQPASVVWMCTEGEHYAGMGADLYSGESIYREAIDHALSGLETDLEPGVRRLVHPVPAASVGPNQSIMSPSRTLPALVATEYAIGSLLLAWGALPAGLIGEGAGVYAAGCFAGVFDIQQAMALAAFEGWMRESLEPTPIPDRGGAADGGIVNARSDEFERFCRSMPFRHPTRPLVSHATGAWITDAEAADPAYWCRRPPGGSRVAEGLQTVLALPQAVVLEVGPGQRVLSLLDRHEGAPAMVASTLRPRDEPGSDVAFLLEAVGRLWAAGAAIEAAGLFAGERRRRVALPTYPFERQRCSNPAPPAPAQTLDGANGVGSIVAPPNRHSPSAASVHDIEHDLAAMWRDVLRLDEVGVGDDFFDLGGHSLGAVRLFGRIQSKFGVDLPLATLVEARTIANLAVLVCDRMAAGTPPASDPRTGDERQTVPTTSFARRSLVTLQPGAGGTPLFVIHGAAGNVLNVTDLARAMGPTQAVFGLQATGVDGVSTPAATIEEMAQSYLGEVRALQPRGPYLLAGYSGGGLIAFEMARRLDAAGEAIGVLALIDTFHPQMPRPHMNAMTRFERLRREGWSYVRDAVGRMRQVVRDTRAFRRIEDHLARGEPVPMALRELYLIRNFEHASQLYVPPLWSGAALLFKAEQVDYYYRAGGPFYGWNNVILGGIELVPIPGDHRSIMLGANAARVARRLSDAIHEVARSGQA